MNTILKKIMAASERKNKDTQPQPPTPIITSPNLHPITYKDEFGQVKQSLVPLRVTVTKHTIDTFIETLVARHPSLYTPEDVSDPIISFLNEYYTTSPLDSPPSYALPQPK